MPEIGERLPPHFRTCLRIPAAPSHRARARLQQTREHAQQRGLAATVRAVDLQYLAGVNVEPDVAKEPLSGAVESQFVDRQKCIARSCRGEFRRDKRVLLHRRPLNVNALRATVDLALPESCSAIRVQCPCGNRYTSSPPWRESADARSAPADSGA